MSTPRPYRRFATPVLAPAFKVNDSSGKAFSGTNGSSIFQSTLTGSAYAASTNANLVLSKLTLTPTTSVTAANGLNAFRGEVNFTAGKTIGSGASSFVTSLYGRVNFNTATVNIASGSVAAVYGKFDMGSTSTLTSGHIAPVQANIVNPPAGAATAAVSLFYGESASGTKIGSIFNGYAAANYAFDLTDVNTSNFLPAISSTTLDGLNIKVNLNGTTYYIKTGAAA